MSKHPPLIPSLAVALLFSVAFLRAAEDQPEKSRDTSKQQQKPTDKPECANCSQTQQHKPSPADNKRKRQRPQPEEAIGKDRPPHPTKDPGSQGLPPDSRIFMERVRSFHQEILNSYRSGNSEAARKTQAELQQYIQDHAERTRHTALPVPVPDHRSGSAPDRDPRSREADRPQVKNELRETKANRRYKEGGRPHTGPPGQRGDQPGGGQDEIARRIEHMQLAAENLALAGRHKQARRLRQQAEHMERGLQRDGEGKMRDPREQLEGEMRKLRDVVDQLKNEINQLKAELHHRGNPQ